jgi:cytochrome d ubiquinol oxidase subunit I
MESHWDTQTAAPYNLIAFPDTENERNSIEMISIPKGLSILAFHNGAAEVKGLKDFPREERPPVLPTFLSFRVMVAMGMLFILLTFIGWILARKDRLESSPLFLRLMLYSLPLPYIGVQIGWIVAEVGRQPWLVYGLLKTSDGVSKSVTPGQVLLSLAGFTLVYGVLAMVDFYLLTKHARKGPAGVPAAPLKAAQTQEV